MVSLGVVQRRLRLVDGLLPALATQKMGLPPLMHLRNLRQFITITYNLAKRDSIKMPIAKAKYFVNPVNGDKQAVVLYTDGSTEIWDSDGSKRATAGGDRFDEYCRAMLNSGYQEDNSPDWQAPSDP